MFDRLKKALEAQREAQVVRREEFEMQKEATEALFEILRDRTGREWLDLQKFFSDPRVQDTVEDFAKLDSLDTLFQNEPRGAAAAGSE